MPSCKIWGSNTNDFIIASHAAGLVVWMGGGSFHNNPALNTVVWRILDFSRWDFYSVELGIEQLEDWTSFFPIPE